MKKGTNSKSRVTIIADDRERGSEALAYLNSMEDAVDLSFGRLRIGDYRVPGGYIFERKTLVDFSQSIKDGRLFRQAQRLASINGERGCVILEGTAASQMSREAIQGALISLALIFNIPVLRALNGKESGNLILTATRQLKRNSDGTVHRASRRFHGKKASQLYLLQGLPGIGKQRALDLLEHFKTVNGVLNAEAAELQKVKGIGRETAEKITWTVSDSQGIYRL